MADNRRNQSKAALVTKIGHIQPRGVYITLVLLGFLTLEYEWLHGLHKHSANAEPRGGWASARTSVLLEVVRQETRRADVEWLRKCLKTPSGRRRLKKPIQRIE